jgi:FixJ family two-component response regulator
MYGVQKLDGNKLHSKMEPRDATLPNIIINTTTHINMIYKRI